MLYTDGILVVDDAIDEIKPLLSYFAKKNIGVKYLNGKEEVEEKIKTRVVFLDLHLSSDIGDVNTEIDTTVGYLSEILEIEYNFILCVWSKHLEHIDRLKKVLFELKICPIQIIQLDKREIIDGKIDIKDEISQKINISPEMLLLTSWKSLVSGAAEKTLEIFDKDYFLGNESENIEKRVKNVCSYFSYKSLEQKYSDSDSNEKIKGWLEIFNNILIDNIRNIKFAKDYPIDMLEESEIKKIITLENSCKVNTVLHLEICSSGLIKPGSLVEVEDYEYEEELLNDIVQKDSIFTLLRNKKEYVEKLTPDEFKDENIGKHLKRIQSNELSMNKSNKEEIIKRVIAESNLGIKVIGLEVTPVCDSAQRKMVKNKVVYGLMVEEIEELSYKSPKLYSDLDNLMGGKKENFIKLPMMTINEKISYIILDMRHYHTTVLSGKYLGEIKQSLLSDIQFKVGKYLSRPGIITF